MFYHQFMLGLEPCNEMNLLRLQRKLLVLESGHIYKKSPPYVIKFVLGTPQYLIYANKFMRQTLQYLNTCKSA